MMWYVYRTEMTLALKIWSVDSIEETTRYINNALHKNVVLDHSTKIKEIYLDRYPNLEYNLCA